LEKEKEMRRQLLFRRLLENAAEKRNADAAGQRNVWQVEAGVTRGLPFAFAASVDGAARVLKKFTCKEERRRQPRAERAQRSEEMRGGNKANSVGGLLERFARRITVWSGNSRAFIIALSVVVIWAITGPVFGFSDSWQLVINTGTTIVTFLMVFLIQRTQNKDSLALHMKLNEIVAAIQGASNRLIDVEDLTEEEVETLHKHYWKLARMAKRDRDIKQSHSIEEAESRHKSKSRVGGVTG